MVAEDSWEMDGDGNWFVDAALSFRFIYDNRDRIVETAQGLNNVYTQFAWGPGGSLEGVIRHSGARPRSTRASPTPAAT